MRVLFYLILFLEGENEDFYFWWVRGIRVRVMICVRLLIARWRLVTNDVFPSNPRPSYMSKFEIKFVLYC